MGANSRKLELQDELERKQQCVTGRKEEIAMSKKQQYERRIQSINEVWDIFILNVLHNTNL